VPGNRGAEGKEKGKGVIVRWGLEEAQSESAGRRTGTGYEVWHTWDERARDREVLHPQRGVLYKSGVYARNGRCLTLGDLSVVRGRTGSRVTGSDRPGEVSRGRSKPEAGEAIEAPQSRKAGQQIGRAATPRDEGPNGAPKGD
jgi:hypothetical protein